jgi:hypothetical protein
MTTAQEPRGYAAAFDQWDDVQPELFAPVLEFAALSAGAIVKHLATKRVEDRKGNKYTLHTFVTRGGNGETFALWGAAALNDRLRALKPGGVIYLAYMGKHPHATEPGKTEHRFIVKTAATPAKLADGMRALEVNHRAMDAFIQSETVRQREERAAAMRGGAASVEHEPPSDLEFAPPEQTG